MRHADLKKALEMLTAGGHAPLPESLLPVAANVRAEAKPWIEEQGIQGYGISEKLSDGEEVGTLALTIYVEKKKPKSQLTAPAPKKVVVPGVAEPIPTDVKEIGLVQKESDTARHRPAHPGCGLGHTAVTVGTLGCLVRKRGTASPLYILSNSHILADDGLATQGDVIVQPGAYDGGVSPADDFAHLAEWIPFDFATNAYPNLVDAAIAKVKKSLVRSAIPGIGVPSGVTTTLRRRMQVQKVGRTTDHTIGLIQDIDYRTRIDYRRPGGGVGSVGFRDQVLCSRYTSGGDSGSLVCTMRGKAVGLHFAGSPSSSVFNRITNVLDALDLDLVTDDI